jgi:tetratricopeptide (TPR) repeat protein
MFGRKRRGRKRGRGKIGAGLITLDQMGLSEESLRTPLIYLSFFVELPFDTGLADGGFNTIDMGHDPIDDWADFDLQSLLGLPPLPEPVVRPCTVMRFRRTTDEVESHLGRLERVFADVWPYPETKVPPHERTRSAVQLIRIAPATTREFGEDWMREQFAIALSKLNDALIALSGASGDHRIAPVHELQLAPDLLGLEGDLRGSESGSLPELHPFVLTLHSGERSAPDYDSETINQAIAILGHSGHTPFHPAMEFLVAARRSLGEGRLIHAVIESGTAVELMVSAVIVGIGNQRGWGDRKFETVLGDKTGFRNRYVDHFAKALSIAVDRDAIGPDPVNTWLREAYPLRNRVAHRGYRPALKEAGEAVVLANGLFDFAMGTAESDPSLGISFPTLEELLPMAGLDERSLSSGRTSETRQSNKAFYRGVEAMRRGDDDAAMVAFAEADRLGDSSAAYNLGHLKLRAGDRAGAIEALRRATERGHRGAPAYLGRLLFEDGHEKEGEKLLEQALPLGHPQAGPLAAFTLADLHHQRGELDRAAELYRLASIDDDFDQAGEAAFRRGRILVDDDMAGAVDAYRRASELGNAIGAMNLGFHLRASKRPREAEAQFRRAMELDPDEGRAAFNLGAMLEEEGRTDEAEAAGVEAVERGVQQALVVMAELAARRGNIEPARRYLRKSREISEPEAVEAGQEVASNHGIDLD